MIYLHVFFNLLYTGKLTLQGSYSSFPSPKKVKFFTPKIPLILQKEWPSANQNQVFYFVIISYEYLCKCLCKNGIFVFAA